MGRRDFRNLKLRIVVRVVSGTKTGFWRPPKKFTKEFFCPVLLTTQARFFVLLVNLVRKSQLFSKEMTIHAVSAQSPSRNTIAEKVGAKRKREVRATRTPSQLMKI